MEKSVSTVVYVDSRLKEIIPFFFSETKKDFSKLETFIGEGNFGSIKTLAHTLKGECGGYGFGYLSDLAKDLEHSAEDSNINECGKHLLKMKTYLESVSIQYKEVA